MGEDEVVNFYEKGLLAVFPDADIIIHQDPTDTPISKMT